MIPNFKTILVWIGVTSIIGGYLFLHKMPMSRLEDRVTALEKIIFDKDLTIHNLNVKLKKCKDDAKVDMFETYYEGLSDANNTPILTNYVF